MLSTWYITVMYAAALSSETGKTSSDANSSPSTAMPPYAKLVTQKAIPIGINPRVVVVVAGSVPSPNAASDDVSDRGGSNAAAFVAGALAGPNSSLVLLVVMPPRYPFTAAVVVVVVFVWFEGGGGSYRS